MTVVDSITDRNIVELLDSYGFVPNVETCDKIRIYISLLLQWNRKISLTTITDPTEIIRFHFGESIFALTSGLVHDGRLADVGSGAGFPGVPLYLARRGLEVTLIESSLKKCTFLRELTRKLQIEGDVRTHCGRMEDFALNGSSQFDYVTARAVGRTPSLLNLASSVLRPIGRAVLWVGESDSKNVPISRSDGWRWSKPILIPGSERRYLLSGQVVPRETK